MDKSQVETIVTKYVGRYRSALGLQKWRLNIYYGPISDAPDQSTAKAQMTIDGAHHSAGMTIDPDAAESEEDVLTTLRHELLHLTHGYFDTYRKSVGAHLSPRVQNSTDEVWELACEHTVSTLEMMLDHGLSIPLKEMGKRPTGKRKKTRKRKKG